MPDVLVLDAAAVRRSLTPAVARASQREALLALHRGTGTAPPRAVMPRAVMPIGEGYTSCYPARHAPGARAVVKVGSFTPENVARGLPAVSATVLVLDPDDGRLRAVVDGGELTTLRTAAASALAVEAPAPHLRGADAPGGRGPTVAVAATTAQAVAGADVVLCCTGGHEPLLDLDDLDPGALVVSVGSVAPDRREVPAALVDTARVVVDSPADCAATCSPVRDAVARGALDPAALTSLGTVLDGAAGPAGGPGRTLYLSLGIGLQDAAAAWAVLAARDAGHALDGDGLLYGVHGPGGDVVVPTTRGRRCSLPPA